MQLHANGLLLLLADLLQKLDEVIWIDHVLDLRLTYRSLVGACFAIQMQKAIAVTAKGSAGLALDDGRRFAIVMVTAQRSCIAQFGPLAGGELLHVVALQDAQAGQCQPQSRGLGAVLRRAVDLFQPGEIQHGLSYGCLGDLGPLLAELTL